MPTTAAPVAPARPTISLAGRDDASLAAGLLSLTVSDSLDGIARCEAVFGNWGSVNGGIGFLYFDRSILDFGKAWQIKLGSSAAAQTVFDGRITGLEAQFPDGQPPRLSVLAEDSLQDLRMTRRTRTFHDVADADVMRQIASDHNLTPKIDLTGPTYPLLAQLNQSDLAFLRERARTIDAEVWVSGTTLLAQARSARDAGNVTLAYGGGLREFEVLADLAHQRTSVTVGGWDPAAKQALKAEARDAALGSELRDGSSGASILGQALGDRKDALVHTAPWNSQETQAEAEAHFKRAARRFLSGWGVADPDGHLGVGASVDLQGLGPLFSGKYYVTAVQHLFDGVRGLRTEFWAERPWLGAAR